jgi:hypothetical protein
MRVQYGRTDNVPLIVGSSTPGLVGMSALLGAGAPVDGVTGAGVTDKGVFYRDTVTGFYYENLGTLAVPEWHGVILA